MNFLPIETKKRMRVLREHVVNCLKMATPADTRTLGGVLSELSQSKSIYFEYNAPIVRALITELMNEGVVGQKERDEFYWNHRTTHCHQTDDDCACKCCGTPLNHVGKVRVCSVCPQTW